MANKCLACDKTARGAALCSRCLRDDDIRKAHGIYTPSDFSLRGLSQRERMLVLLWASGADVRDYLPNRTVTITPPSHAELTELDDPTYRLSIYTDRFSPTWAKPTVTPCDDNMKGVHHG